MSQKEANTVNGETIIFIILGLVIPLWPISLPLFGWLAYRSYQRGVPAGSSSSLSSLDDLQKAKQLLDAGILSQVEFDRIKAQALNNRG